MGEQPAAAFDGKIQNKEHTSLSIGVPTDKNNFIINIAAQIFSNAEFSQVADSEYWAKTCVKYAKDLYNALSDYFPKN